MFTVPPEIAKLPISEDKFGRIIAAARAAGITVTDEEINTFTYTGERKHTYWGEHCTKVEGWLQDKERTQNDPKWWKNKARPYGLENDALAWRILEAILANPTATPAQLRNAGTTHDRVAFGLAVEKLAQRGLLTVTHKSNGALKEVKLGPNVAPRPE